MENAGKPLLNTLGWIFVVWGILTVVYDVLALWAIVPVDSYWLMSFFGPTQIIVISLVVGAAEIFAGIMARKWMDDPDRALGLLYIGATMLAFFLLEAFFSWTQIREVYWFHLVLGLVISGLYCWGAWINRE